MVAVKALPEIPEIAKRLSDAGASLKKAKQYRAAVSHFRRAIAMCPEHPLLWENLGATLWDLSDMEGALAAYEHAKTLGPVSHKNLGLIYASLGQSEDAEREFRIATHHNPDDASARWNLANLHLADGDYKRGFAEYESRFDYLGTAFFPKMPYPLWNGRDDLNGKTIMIAPEQGAGDCILMSRYFAVLKEKYPRARLLHMVPSHLESLFWGYRGIVEFIPMGVPWPEADYCTWQMSLPRHLGTMVEAIPADPGVIRNRIEPYKNAVELPKPNLPSLKVGLRWTGNPEQQQNAARSVPLELMAEFAELPEVCAYSLQVGDGADDVARLGYGQLIWDMSRDLSRGYVATATAMLHLDLVITVCTSIAHLGGCLGVPTWVMLCHDAYWIWGRERKDSPWHPSATLFRQSKPGEWRPVIDAVKSALAQRAMMHLSLERAA